MISAMFACALSEIQFRQAEEAAFQKAMDGLPADVAMEMRRKRQDEQAAAYQRATEERRHRELCDAIRSTSFWRF